jgi:hypothetical protein
MTTRVAAQPSVIDRGFYYCLLLLAALIPFQHRYYQWLKDFSRSLIDVSWGLPAYFEINVDLFVADLLIVALFLVCHKVSWKSFLWEGARKYLSLFLLIALVSIFTSSLPTYPLHYWRWLHVALPAGLFYLVGGRGKIDFSLLAKVIVLASLLEAGIAIAQYFTQHSLGLKLLGEPTLISRHDVGPRIPVADGAIWIGDHFFHGPRDRSFILRASGTLPHPNILGGMMVFGLLMTYYLYECARKKIGWAVAIFVQLFCLFVTYSRSALYALVATTVLWALCQKKLSLLFLVVGSGFAVCVALLYPQLFERGGVISYTVLAQVSDMQRVALHEIGWQMMGAHPVVGVGFNSYMIAFQGMFEKTAQDIAYLHNIYLHLAAEIGLPGLLAFLVFCALVVKRGWQLRSRLEVWAPLSVFVAFLGIGLADHYPICDISSKLAFFLTGGLIYAQQDH